MGKLILALHILFFLNSCSIISKAINENQDSEIEEIETVDLDKSDLKFKIGPHRYNNESKVHLVYGVTVENPNQNFITEIHFNFGGNINCDNKALNATFDFKNSTELIHSDSINYTLPALKYLIQRTQKDSRVVFDFKNLNRGILVWGIEKVNLKPNGKKNKVDLIIKSQCLEYLKLPLILIKYNVSEINQLINIYVKNELDRLSETELIKTTVIFSYNQIHKEKGYLLDMVDQRNMLILSYDPNIKEYIITDFEKKIIKKIKRT